jgi:subtilisin family serine protease
MPTDATDQNGGGAFPPSVDWGIARIKADQNTGPRGAGVSVVILDTGCSLTHSYLLPGFLPGPVSYNGIYPTRNAEDGNGHGSHCSGIIGMRDVPSGFVGTAPQCYLIPVKGLSDRGFGLTSWIVMGMDWADANMATYNIKVVSMSFGGGGYDAVEEAAINQGTTDGLTFVAAAGNSFQDVIAGQFCPAMFANVITVSALAPGDQFAGYSNYGAAIDLIAPGSSITATFRNERTATLSGTSMACPHVAGCCALWFSNHLAPGGAGNFAAVKAALLASAEPAPVGGWPGDPDGIKEPLVNALNLDQP